MVAKIPKKFGMSGICGKTIPHMEVRELKKYNIQYPQSRWNKEYCHEVIKNILDGAMKLIPKIN